MAISDEPAGSIYRIVDFLRRQPEFEFHLPEYIESTRFIAEARDRFQRFCNGFMRGPPPVSPWCYNRLRFAYLTEGVRAYARIDWSAIDVEDIIPLLEKHFLRANTGDYVSDMFSHGDLWVKETSGSTGCPITAYYAPDFFVDFQFLSVCKIAWLAGELNAESRERATLCLAPHDKKYLTDRVWSSPDGEEGLFIRPTFDERDPASVDRLIRLLEEEKPAFLTLKPNMLDFLLRSRKKELSRACRDLRLIISGGADLADRLRQEAESVTGTSVVNAYGLSEIGFVASECDRKCGLHVYHGDVLTEVLISEDVLRQEGVGELILSSLSNKAMPLLRYRTGDTVELSIVPCECGKLGPRIINMSGRILKNFRLPDDTEYAPTDLDVLFKEFSIREFSITQVDQRSLRAEVEFLDSCNNPIAELRKIEEYLRAEFRGHLTVDAVLTSFPKDAKFQRYRSEV